MERWTARFGALPLLAAACAFAVALYFVWESYWAHADYWDNGAMVIFWRTGLALTFGALVLRRGAAARHSPVRLRPLDYLGDISYGIYLWHLPVILMLKELSLAGSPGAVPRAMTLAAVIALSALTWHLFERPIIRRFH